LQKYGLKILFSFLDVYLKQKKLSFKDESLKHHFFTFKSYKQAKSAPPSKNVEYYLNGPKHFTKKIMNQNYNIVITSRLLSKTRIVCSHSCEQMKAKKLVAFSGH